MNNIHMFSFALLLSYATFPLSWFITAGTTPAVLTFRCFTDSVVHLLLVFLGENIECRCASNVCGVDWKGWCFRYHIQCENTLIPKAEAVEKKSDRHLDDCANKRGVKVYQDLKYLNYQSDSATDFQNSVVMMMMHEELKSQLILCMWNRVMLL